MAEQNSINNQLPAIWQQTPSGTTENVIMNSSGELGSAAGSSQTTVTTFTSSGTWNKSANARFIHLYIWSGAAGGGSGRRGTSGNASGGSGSSGSNFAFWSAPASFFSNSVSVTVGAGGLGGAAVTTDDTDGNDGSPHNDSQAGSIVPGFRLASSLAGIGGTTSGTGNPDFSDGLSNASIDEEGSNFGGEGNIGADGSPAPTGFLNLFGRPAGGGGGAGWASGSSFVGGDGQSISNGRMSLILGGLGGNSIAGDGLDNTTAATEGFIAGGSGGGGGGTSLSDYSAAGGTGGFPGGGAGGGGGVPNGGAAAGPDGPGGDGGAGRVIIVEIP